MGRDSRQGRAAVEDQPTDTSDLTDTGGPSKDTAASPVDKPAPTRGAVPVGKRGGRHRTFRPRPVAAGPGSSDTAAGDAAEDTVEAESPAVEETVEAESPAVEETVEAESPAVEETVEAESPAVEEIVEETVETEIAAESSPKAKRRRWFRGRADKAADATAEADVVEEPSVPSEIAESADDVEELPAEEPDGDEPDAKPVGPIPVGRRMVIAVAVAAALFVAAGALGGGGARPDRPRSAEAS